MIRHELRLLLSSLSLPVKTVCLISIFCGIAIALSAAICPRIRHLNAAEEARSGSSARPPTSVAETTFCEPEALQGNPASWIPAVHSLLGKRAPLFEMPDL